MRFSGNIVALVTPFRNGEFDRAGLAKLIESCIDAGVDGLVPCGTTGESPTLSHDEHDAVVAFTVETAAGRLPVIAGTGSNSTAEAVRLTRAAARAGADGVLSVTPYYNKPTQDGLAHHFRAVADASDLPVVLYDIPGRTGVRIEPATYVALAEHPNVQSVKVATGDVEDVTMLRRETDLTPLCGDDALAMPMIALGAGGVVSVLANLLPGPMSDLVRAAMAGDVATARDLHERLHPLMKAMFLESNPVPVKVALAWAERITEEVRPPLAPMREENRRRLVSLLDPFADAIRL